MTETPSATLRALEQRIQDLVALWLCQQAGYPSTCEGQHAAAAVRCCASELAALLPVEAPRPQDWEMPNPRQPLGTAVEAPREEGWPERDAHRKFRKLPVVVSAVQWTGTNADDVLDFTRGLAEVRDESYRRVGSNERVLIIETLEGSMRAEPGDWIIRGVKGEFYPCKPDVFAVTYEPASAPPAPERTP